MLTLVASNHAEPMRKTHENAKRKQKPKNQYAGERVRDPRNQKSKIKMHPAMLIHP